MIRYIKYAAGIFLFQTACLWWGFLAWSSTQVSALAVIDVATALTMAFLILGFMGFVLTSLLGAGFAITKIPVPVKSSGATSEKR